MVKTKKVLVRIPIWMYNAIATEKRISELPTSINKIILEALNLKYRKLSKEVNKQ